MECNCRSLLQSAIYRRSRLDMYLWILVIIIPVSASTERSSADTTKTLNIAQKDSNQEAHSTISDSGAFIQSLDRDLYLATAFLSESVTLQSTANDGSQSLVPEAKFGIAPSFELLEADMPSESFKRDIHSNTYPLVTTEIPSTEIAMLNKSDGGYRVPTLLIPKDEPLEYTKNATITSTAYPLTDSRVTNNAAILQYDRHPATDKLKLSTDTATEMYSPSHFISSSMPVIPPTEYSAMPNVLDNIKLMMRNVISDASGVSLSQTSGVTATLSPETNSSEQFYINTLLMTATPIVRNTFSLSPSQQSGSVLVNISTYDTSTSGTLTKGSTMNVGLSWTHSLTNTPVLSYYRGTVLLTNTSDQIVSARHPNKTYNSSEYTSWSPVDISPAPGFTRDFELNTAVSGLARPFSDFTVYPSGDYSDTIPSAGHLPFGSRVFYTSRNTTAVFVSDWKPASVLPEPSINLTAGVSQHPGGNIYGSTVILTAESSSATGVYYQPSVVDTKEWAMPVTAGLSVALLMAVVVVVLVCFRAKHRHDDPGHHRDGDDTPAVHTRQEQWRTGHTTVLSVSELPQRYKQQIDTGVLKKPRVDRNPNVGQKHAVVNAGKPGTNPSPTAGLVTRREIFEMDNMSAPANENVYTQQNTQSNREERYSDNEDLIYDDPTFIHDSSDSRHGFSERIQSSPIPVNRLALLCDNMLYTFNKSPHAEFETSKTSNRIWQNEPKIKTRHILGDEQYISATDSSASRVSHKHTDHHQQDAHEPAQPGYSSSNDGYVSDECRSEHCWESWDDRKYVKGERGIARISVVKDNSSTNGEDNNSLNAVYPNIRASASGRADRKPGMYKCISFDETRLGMTENTIPVFSKNKSPTRKISTISESAMTYLKVPQDGCVSMTSAAYETVNDLTGVGNPSGSSQFFIGSFSNERNNLNGGQKAFEKHLGTSGRHSIDNVKDTASKELAASETTERIHEDKPDHDSEKQRKPQDDYIFPIVRKAKIKILEERRNKKLESTNSGSDDNVITAADHLWRYKNASKNGTQNREYESIVNEASSVPASSADLPSRRVSHPSNIPTIVLTKEEDEATADTRRQNNLLHQAGAKPPRVRRLARANNPFLIEVDSSAISEKVRRLSAPAMTSSSVPTPGTGSRDGMIRSASNDHLSRCDRHNRFNAGSSRRPWSSEFLDLIINSEGYSKDERLKKMIDDRYDALFNHKYPYPAVGSRSDDHSFQQDLSPRIWKLLTATSHAPLPCDEHGNTGYSSRREIGDTEIMSRLSPILDIRTSGQLHPLSNETDRLSRERNPPRHYPELQLEMPSSNEAATDTVAAIKSRKHVTPKTPQREHTKIVPVRDSHSPRPNLAHGTDGIDSGTDGIDSGTGGLDSGTGGIDSGTGGIDSGTDGIDSGTGGIDSGTDGIDSGTGGIDSGTGGIDSGTDGIDSGTGGIDSGTDGTDNCSDIPEKTSLGNWPRSTRHDNKSNQFQASGSSVNNSNKLIHAKPYWESFEDDFEVERLLVGNKSNSGEAFISNKHRDPNHLPPISSEFPSHETSNATVVSHNYSLSQKFNDAEVGVSRWPNIDDVNSVKKSAHSQIDTSRSECSPIAVFDSNIPLSRNLSTSKQTNQETFADNFSINNSSVNRQAQEMAHKVSNPQIASGVPHHSNWENQHKQNIQTRPDIPPRKARRRAQRNPKLVRPPSPFLSSNRPDSQSMACQDDNGSLQNDANNTQAMTDNERNNCNDDYYLSQSLSREKNKSSDSVSVASTLGSLQQRSYSLNEDTGTKMVRPKRAVTLETDQPSAHFTDFNDWSNLFTKVQSRFLSSASNTVLQHSHDILNDSISLSDPEMEQYFGATVSSSSLSTQRKVQTTLGTLLLNDNDDFGARISNV